MKTPPILILSLLAGVALAEPVDIGSRRELFVDDFLIESLDGAALRMHRPQPAPPCKKPLPIRGSYGSYVYGSVLKDGNIFRMYGRKDRGQRLPDNAPMVERFYSEVTAYAESPDGVNWTEPNLGIYDNVPEIKEGNVVLAWELGATHNFTPFIDTNPNCPPDQRYKGLGGSKTDRTPELTKKYGAGGLIAFVSADGLRWKQLQQEPIIPVSFLQGNQGGFDSQNVAFWDAVQEQYVCYFRVFNNSHSPDVRSVRRVVSKDFIHWDEPVDLELNRPLPGGPNRLGNQFEQIYINNIKPYFRAPHIYIGLPTHISFRWQRNAPCDSLLVASRDGVRFTRISDEKFLRPGVTGAYSNRGHYLSCQAVQTGPAEISLYTYQPNRYTLRLDGFASLNAPFEGGSMVTKPLVFDGASLEINAQTAGIGHVRIEIQDAEGKPIPGFSASDCDAFNGDAVDYNLTWRGSGDVSNLAGQTVRLHFVLKDADVYSYKFN